MKRKPYCSKNSCAPAVRSKMFPTLCKRCGNKYESWITLCPICKSCPRCNRMGMMYYEEITGKSVK